MDIKTRLWNIPDGCTVTISIRDSPVEHDPILATAKFCEWCPCGYDFIVTDVPSRRRINRAFQEVIGFVEDDIDGNIERYLKVLIGNDGWHNRIDYTPSAVNWTEGELPTSWIIKGKIGQDIIVTMVEE